MNANLLAQSFDNIILFQEIQRLGFDYILNPKTHELHRGVGGRLAGQHNLDIATLQYFIWLANLCSFPVHLFPDGTPIPVYDLVTGVWVGQYSLKKCKHCFPLPIMTQQYEDM